MDGHAQQRNLDEIEQRIASRRFDYLHATWQADNALDDTTRLLASGEAEHAERDVDDLLDEWDRCRTGREATT